MLHVTPGLLEQAPVSVVTAEPGAKFVLIPDASLLFKADFHRAGPDLVLTGEDGHRTLVQDYFRTDAPLPLMAPNGAGLQPDVIDLLTGSPAANQYAQAGAAAQSAAGIGTVKTLIGNVSVVRNGVEVTLKVGDVVYKSDVVQTASGSAVGISFPDGTALHLTANARMALTDYSFDAGSAASNGALFNLVEGTFSFVAGQVAKGGVGMKIGTPVATMAIRGTTGWVQQQVATINVNLGNLSYSFAVVDDQGTTQSGIYDLVDSTGNVIATVSNKGVLTFVTGQGVGQSPLVQTQQMSAEQLSFEQQIVQAVFNAVGIQNIVPRSDQGHDSTPAPPPLLPQNYQYTPGDNPTTTFTVNVPGAPGPANVTIVYTPPPPQNHSPTLDAGTVGPIRANSGGAGLTVAAIFAGKFHDADANSQLAGIAVAGNNTTDQGSWEYSVDGGTTWIEISTSVSATAALVLTADTLLRFNPDTNFYGTVPPLVVFAIDNTFPGLTTGAVIDASGGGGNSPISDSPADISASVGANTWTPATGGAWTESDKWSNGDPTPTDVVLISLPSGESVTFDADDPATIAKLINVGDGTLNVTDDARLTITDAALNQANIEVTDGGRVKFDSADVDNRTGAKIEADGCDSQVRFSGGEIKNAGKIQAVDGGEVKFYNAEVHNDGTIAAKWGGEVKLWNTVVDNTLGDSGNGFIKAIGCDSVVELYNVQVIGGTLKTGYGGVIVTDSGGSGPGEFDSTEFNGATEDCDGCLIAVNIEGHVVVEEGSNLTLLGKINNNEGEIEVTECAQLAIKGEVTLGGCGCGEVTLDGGSIIGHPDSDCNTLVNVNNVISGSGNIGNGCDSDLTLVNESDGMIVADDDCGTLTIDTGSNDVENAGLMLATDGGTLIVYSDIDNECGTIQVDCDSYLQIVGDICGGEANINGGTLQYDGQNNTDTNFICGSDGTLVVGASVNEVGGLVSGADSGDVFRFLGIDFDTASFDYCEDDGTLTVTDFDSEVIVHLTTDYSDANFSIVDDGNGHAQVQVNLF